VDVTEAIGCDDRLLSVLSHAHRQLAHERWLADGRRQPLDFLAALPAASLDGVFIVYDVVPREFGAAGTGPSPEEIRSSSRAYCRRRPARARAYGSG
jgi:hypothetical protein